MNQATNNSDVSKTSTKKFLVARYDGKVFMDVFR